MEWIINKKIMLKSISLTVAFIVTFEFLILFICTFNYWYLLITLIGIYFLNKN